MLTHLFDCLAVATNWHGADSVRDFISRRVCASGWYHLKRRFCISRTDIVTFILILNHDIYLDPHFIPRSPTLNDHVCRYLATIHFVDLLRKLCKHCFLAWYALITSFVHVCRKLIVYRLRLEIKKQILVRWLVVIFIREIVAVFHSAITLQSN